MDELFSIPPCDSPRLAWMKKHGVTIGPNNNFVATDSDDFRYGYSLIAECSLGAGYGNTDDEAIVDLAKRSGLKLWNES